MQYGMNARSLTPNPSPKGRGEAFDATELACFFGVQ